MLYKSKNSSVQFRPKKIGNTFIGNQTDLSQYGYYTVINAKPTDAPEGQRYVDSGNGIYDEQAMTYTADWVLEDIPPEPVPDYGTKITKLAMSNRLTQEEEIAVDLASFGETTNAAAVRRFLRKLELASYIDLERADTIAGVQMLETGGLIGVGRADEILNTPATEEERWKGQE